MVLLSGPTNQNTASEAPEWPETNVGSSPNPVTTVTKFTQRVPPKVPGNPGGQNLNWNNILGGIGQGLNNLLGGNFFRRGRGAGATTAEPSLDRILYDYK